MPHKHKRDKLKNEPSYDLPPTTIARPLPVLETAPPPAKLATIESRHGRKSRSNRGLVDDTPRAFTRLMNYQTTGRKPPKGLDDGAPTSKKRKRNAESNTTAQPSIEPGSVVPTILPSEPLSAFSARVDVAIPVSGLTKSKRSSVTALGPRERQTKMEKRMQRMQAEWREAAAKRKEKLIEEEDMAEAEEMRDGDGNIGGVSGNGKAGRKIKAKGKSKRRKVSAVIDNNEGVDDDDPWAVIAAKRLENSSTIPSGSRSGGLVGLHDVVLAPPKFSKAPKDKTITGNTGSIGGARHVGNGSKKGLTMGLKRQEELGEARRSVVESYRRMMNERRGAENNYV
ncbi:hypothetical protein MMC22_005109 [Lobaria immixta]|nr:hypothetical protein [Lobaria immixta]